MAGGCTSLTILGELTVIEPCVGVGQAPLRRFRNCLAQSVNHNAVSTISQTIILNVTMAKNHTLCT
jgi:hypothetical protein